VAAALHTEEGEDMVLLLQQLPAIVVAMAAGRGRRSLVTIIGRKGASPTQLV